MFCSQVQRNEQPPSVLTSTPNVVRTTIRCASVGWKYTELVTGGRPFARAASGAANAASAARTMTERMRSDCATGRDASATWPWSRRERARDELDRGRAAEAGLE